MPAGERVAMASKIDFIFWLACLSLAAPALASPQHDEDGGERPIGPAHRQAASSQPPGAAAARPGARDGDDEDDEGRARDGPIVVTARQLDAARTGIDEALGATVYVLSNETVEHRPGGETRSIADILLQTPSVRSDGGSMLVRGSPSVQYRLNNIILPEGIADIGERISARLADNTRLITGALPAQYGAAVGGVVSITTKNGLYQRGGQAELFGGSHGTLEPAFEWSGSAGGSSLFASGSFRRARSEIATTAGLAAEDRLAELEGFVFADHLIDSENRVSLIAGGSSDRNRIAVSGASLGVDRAADHYGVVSVQHSAGPLAVQASIFAALSRERTRFARTDSAARRTYGTQIEGAYQLADGNRLRSGLLVSAARQRDRDVRGIATRRRTDLGAFVQDEWKLSSVLTINAGARTELFGGGSEARVEPRASLVWNGGSGVSAHAGYARYAQPVPLDEGAPRRALRDECDDYYDIGAQRAAGGLTIGLDAFWRDARDLLAERRNPTQATAEAFNFGSGRFRGVELAMTYAEGPVTAWSNLSLSHAGARGIATRQNLFTPGQLAYAASHRVALGQDQRLSGSAGASYRIDKLLLSADLLAGSGARRSRAAGAINDARLGGYAVIGLAAVYRVRFLDRPADLRLDVTNLFDARYTLSDASRLEGGWTRFGERRGIFVGIEQGF